MAPKFHAFRYIDIIICVAVVIDEIFGIEFRYYDSVLTFNIFVKNDFLFRLVNRIRPVVISMLCKGFGGYFGVNIILN